MKRKVQDILEKLKDKLSINERIDIKIRPMKRKIASISLRRREIRINSHLLPDLSDEELNYIIAHELLHLKHGIYHICEFEEELVAISSPQVRYRLFNHKK
jgi:predicted metal-dependent hydrolase